MFRGWNRNLSIMKQLLDRAGAMEPSMRYTAEGFVDFDAWKSAFGTKLAELMGPFPPRVPPRAQTVARIEREHDLVEKFVIDVEDDLAAPGYLLIPKSLKPVV